MVSRIGTTTDWQADTFASQPASPAGGPLTNWRPTLEQYQQAFCCCEVHTPDIWEGDGTCIICEAVELKRRLDAALAVASPSAPDCADQLRTLARDIGTVQTVASRRSDPDADHRAMLARLEQWQTTLHAIVDHLPSPSAPAWSPEDKK